MVANRMRAPDLLPMSRLHSMAKGFADGSDIKIGRSSWIAQVSPGESPGPSKVERKAELGRRDEVAGEGLGAPAGAVPGWGYMQRRGRCQQGTGTLVLHLPDKPGNHCPLEPAEWSAALPTAPFSFGNSEQRNGVSPADF